jgi:hypothetical protein
MPRPWRLAPSAMPTSTHTFDGILWSAGESQRAKVADRLLLAERRLKSRHPLDLRVRFRFSSAGSHFSGTGLAVNISSGGILVASKHQMIVGTLVELSIEWPSLLQGRIPLQLIAMGRVLRREASHFAAAFERREFRTMKISSPLPDEEAALSDDGPPSLPSSPVNAQPHAANRPALIPNPHQRNAR